MVLRPPRDAELAAMSRVGLPSRERTMRRSGLLTASALATLLSVPALASPCEDQIRALEARVDDASSRAAALSGGGQGVAASRESQAIQADAQKSPSGTVQRLPEH